ncbi:MAG: ectoine synthase [Bacillaceae bacterium]|nr:ectoine synthase [Bacillaceae bacterium]
MIVKNLEDILGTEDDVDGGNWVSRRLLLKKDGMGFSLHDTIIKEGTETYIWYKNHLEAVYCVEGEGEIEVLGEGKIYPIKPGTMYALDGHEKHYLRAKKQMRMVCVFNPPVTGKEVHDEEGTYPIIED